MKIYQFAIAIIATMGGFGGQNHPSLVAAASLEADNMVALTTDSTGGDGFDENAIIMVRSYCC